MKTPDNPVHEVARLRALQKTGLLDTPPEERFDRLTRMATRIFGVPIALITLVDTNRQWFKSCQGLGVSETPRTISFCGHAILKPGLFIIEDARQDERFHDNPLVTGEPHIRFYAGAPLYSSDGHRLGTLCLIDSEPGQLAPTQQAILEDLADCASRELQLHLNQDAFEELANRERRAQSIIEGTQVGTWEWNVQTGETVFNERWANICGYTLAELEPVAIQTWLDLAHPDDLADSKQRLNEHFSGNTAEYDFRCRMRHKEGHWVWVHDRGKVLEWTRDGLPLKMYGTHADITREMETLQRMEQQNRALAILNELALDQSSSPEQKLSQALELGARFLQLPIAILSEIIGSTYTIREVHAPADAGLARGQTFPYDQTYCALMLKDSGHLAISHMARSRHRGHPCYEAFGLEAYIAAPIRTRNGLYGTLNFSCGSPRDREFTETEITFVTLLAEWMASLLDEQLTSQTLSKLVSQLPGMLYQYRLWPDGQSTFPYASPGIQDLYGLSPEEAARDAAKVFSTLHPDDLQAVVDSIDISASGLTLWQQQYRVEKNGQWRWLEGRSMPEELADGSIVWHGYITDVDERKRGQLRLQESEEQFRRLFELSPIGIALADYETGQILDVNNALLQPTDYSRAGFLSLTAETLFLEQYEGMRETSLRELKTNGRFGPYEYDMVRADGSRFPAIVHAVLITSTSGRTLIWTWVEDISERKKADQIKNEFISTVSHELRTPLTSISGSLSLIASEVTGPLPDRVKPLVAVAARNSDQLRHLIDDLLDMEKLVSGEMTFVSQPCDVAPLVTEALEQIRPYAMDRDVRFKVTIDAQDAQAVMDDQRFRQALNNLLSNAIKFSPDHSEIRVEVSVSDTVVTVSVADQGPGIPEDFHSRIFQKFAQADSSDTRNKGGTGLGLAITREIMIQMEGDIGFESPPGHGARFWLTLPRHTT